MRSPIALLVFLVLFLVPMLVWSADSSDGCGLGWQLTQKTSLLATTTRTATNITIPNTFGMTSGTLGCAQHSIVKRDEPAAKYVVTNFDALQIDMARGRGEYLNGLVRVFGCDDSAVEMFRKLSQSQFKEMCSKNMADPFALFLSLKTQLKLSPALRRLCRA